MSVLEITGKMKQVIAVSPASDISAIQIFESILCFEVFLFRSDYNKPPHPLRPEEKGECTTKREDNDKDKTVWCIDECLDRCPF